MADHGEQSGVEIDALHELGADAPGLGAAGPDDDERFAGAPFLERRLAAVIREEDDEDRIVAKPCGVDGVRESANRLIEAFDHGGVEGVFLW